jgi:hypothetical protein
VELAEGDVVLDKDAIQETDSGTAVQAPVKVGGGLTSTRPQGLYQPALQHVKGLFAARTVRRGAGTVAVQILPAGRRHGGIIVFIVHNYFCHAAHAVGRALRSSVLLGRENLWVNNNNNKGKNAALQFLRIVSPVSKTVG